MMRKTTDQIGQEILLIVSLIILLNMGLLAQSRNIDFNSDWRFCRGELPEATSVDFNDSAWKVVQLPHDWSIEGPFSEDHPALSRGAWLPAGKGTYRKTFTVSGSKDTDKVFIYFDGVYRNSVVYLNGNRIGYRPFGYIGFEYDLTDFINFDQPNVLVVTVDNSEQPGSRWYSGSGIYRDVTLKIRKKVYIPNWGLHVTTPVISAQQAKVQAAISLKNEFPESKTVTVTSSLVRDGKTVATFDEILDLNQGAETTCKVELIVNDPALWSPDSPELYRLDVELRDDDKLLDKGSTNVGIRSFSFDAEKGFGINGKWTRIKGVCLHHDGGPLGAAVQRRTLERQLEILREMGCNAIRTGHAPFSTEFLNLCDEMGFLVMNDAFDEWSSPRAGPVMRDGARVIVRFQYYAKHFDEWAEKDLTDFVLRDRNHPSIFMWGIGAKVYSRMKVDELKTASWLTSIVSQLDDRPVMNGVSDDSSTVIGELKADKDLEEQRNQYPESAVIVGECYSAQSFYPRGTYLYGKTKEKWWDSLGYESDATFEWADRRGITGDEGIDAWRAVKQSPYVMGQFIWAGWDYLGETVPFGWPARSSSFAPIDLCGFPKDGYFFYQSQWTDEPMVHIFPHWNLEGHEGETIDIYGFTNCDEVELFQDGRSLGRRKNDPSQVNYQNWKTVYTPGELKAVAFKNGVKVASKVVSTAGPAARVNLFARRDQVKADGKDLIYVECTIHDVNGNLVPYASNELHIAVKGEASLVATGNGNPFDQSSFQSASRVAFNGKCLAILQTTGNPGAIEVKVTSSGLDGQSLVIQSRK
ncbi:MAG: sugar-binding domain-containing protein [Puniceicoccaceae bacterium]